MRLCVVSDTHGYHRYNEIPECDLFIHCGDITGRGEMHIIDDFSDWLGEVPAKHRIVIFGNHEMSQERPGKQRDVSIKLIEKNAIYLEDSSVVIEGYTIHGSPISPFFYNWAWNRQRGPDIKKHWDLINAETNILITHSPPFNILDEAPRSFGQFENVGCKDLLRRVMQLKKLKLHCFGHIHSAAGQKEIDGIKFVNASICTEDYKPTNKPIIIDL